MATDEASRTDAGPKDAPRFVVVGGGTAGWLAALVLKDAARRSALPIRLTVVESSRIPTIGVGEGTTAVFRQLLRHLGLDEAEFVTGAGATIKFGIRHRDWRRLGHTYDGPIDDPVLVTGDPGGGGRSWLDLYSVAAGRKVSDAHLFAHLMALGRGPLAKAPGGGIQAVGPFHHAYHFDQALAGRYLRSRAKGIELIDAKVVGARRRDDGAIAALVTEEAGEVEGDFFVDCTGFRRQLIAGELGARWISYADALPVNRAMPFWLDLEDDEELAPYTLAWAQGSGWLWSIPTQGRYGCGYVYSDRFLDPEGARREIEAALGRPVEPRNDLRFDIGRLDRSFVGNCLAVGLSSSFLEPLEATSIHGTIVQLLIFARFHLKDPARMTDVDRDRYNTVVGRQVDDFRDFINLHYVSERDDTPFWRAVREEYVSPATREKVARWRRKMPGEADFETLPGGLPHVEQQLHYPVLDGLGLLDRAVARAEMAAKPRLRAIARKTVDDLTREYRRAALRALGHRDCLDHFRDASRLATA